MDMEQGEALVVAVGKAMHPLVAVDHRDLLDLLVGLVLEPVGAVVGTLPYVAVASVAVVDAKFVVVAELVGDLLDEILVGIRLVEVAFPDMLALETVASSVPVVAASFAFFLDVVHRMPFVAAVAVVVAVVPMLPQRLPLSFSSSASSSSWEAL